jgi:hypothetical protein
VARTPADPSPAVAAEHLPGELGDPSTRRARHRAGAEPGLLESTSQETEEMTDDELFAELERRHTEFEQDPSVAIPWSELEKEE